MARHAHEFYCHCGYWNYPMLSDTMHGNYTIRCGFCEHEHYRVIKAGVVTDDRHDETMGRSDTIHIPRAACSKERRVLGQIAQLRALEASSPLGAGDHPNQSLVTRLWRAAGRERKPGKTGEKAGA